MKLLFLCTGNSCRSQMAEGYGHRLLPESWEIYSAGIQADGMNAHAMRVMAEDGVDITGQHSKTVAEVPWAEMDLIITLCGHAAETCPSLPVAARVLHWGLEDPAYARGTQEVVDAKYREIRDQIRQRIVDFLATEIGPAVA